MDLRLQFTDSFLRNLDDGKLRDLEGRLRAWQCLSDEFLHRLDAWFANFAEADRSLAWRILENIKYFTESEFGRNVSNSKQTLFAELGPEHEQTSIFVVPKNPVDSAHRHAYTLSKSWGVSEDRYFTPEQLADLDLSERALVFFNDTHGTGNQFVREFKPLIDSLRPAKTVIFAVTFAHEAIGRLRDELPDAILVPGHAERNAREVFRAAELDRIRELGERIYPEHPLGYGGCALLTAYSFQCPNNTLPLIWADGKNNGHAWKALFPYRPKAKRTTALAPPAPRQVRRRGQPARLHVLVRMNPDLEGVSIESLPVTPDRSWTIPSPRGGWHKSWEVSRVTWAETLAGMESTLAELEALPPSVVHLAAYTPFSLATVLGNRILRIRKHELVVHQPVNEGGVKRWRAWAKRGPVSDGPVLSLELEDAIGPDSTDIKLCVEITWPIDEDEIPHLGEAPTAHLHVERTDQYAIEDDAAARRAALDIEQGVAELIRVAPKSTLHLFYSGPYAVCVLAPALWDKIGANQDRPRIIVYERREQTSGEFEFWPAVAWPSGALAEEVKS